MRTIKFRGRSINGEWHCGLLSISQGGLNMPEKGYYISNSGGSPWAFNVIPETIGQYTGLKDKKGKKIFEGDILKYTRTKWQCYGHPQHNTDLIQNELIVWEEKKHAFRSKTIDLTRNKISGKFGAVGYLSFNDVRADKNIIEIVGNIHENPELIK